MYSSVFRVTLCLDTMIRRHSLDFNLLLDPQSKNHGILVFYLAFIHWRCILIIICRDAFVAETRVHSFETLGHSIYGIEVDGAGAMDGRVLAPSTLMFVRLERYLRSKSTCACMAINRGVPCCAKHYENETT